MNHKPFLWNFSGALCMAVIFSIGMAMKSANTHNDAVTKKQEQTDSVRQVKMLEEEKKSNVWLWGAYLASLVGAQLLCNKAGREQRD